MFAQRFGEHWDLVIYLKVSFEKALRRQLVRDGGDGDPTFVDRFWTRYVGAQRLYRTEHTPEARADIVIDNEDVHAPVAYHLLPDQEHHDDWQCVVQVYRHYVVKRPKSVAAVEATLTRQYSRFADNPEQARAEAETMVDAYLEGCNLVRRSSLPRWCVGEPRFLEHGGYAQVRATVCRAAIVPDHPDVSRARIRSYFDLVERLWRHGLHERTQNLMCNAGVDPEGRMILLDFGEMSQDRALVFAELACERWRRSESFTKDLPDVLRADFEALARARWTTENLARHWARSM